MVRSKLLAYGTMFVGMCVIFASLLLIIPGAGAWETTYELHHSQTEMPEDDRPSLFYSELEWRDKRVVDRAIQGETVRRGFFGNSPPNEFPPVVIHDLSNDTVYIFETTDPQYVIKSTQGAGAIVMLLIGIGLTAVAVRFDINR
ncbi:MAG: hypothetical protein ACI9PP_001804 [Halobacteriales archaeon]|jgi:hypothetical protein